MFKKIFVLLSILLSFSCSCKKNMKAVQNSHDSLYEIASKEYTDNFDMIYNSTKEYVLVKKDKSERKNDAFPTIFYSIINSKSNKIIFKDVVPGGKVKWSSDYIIEVKSLVGRPKDILNSNNKRVLYKLNVKSLKKSK